MLFFQILILFPQFDSKVLLLVTILLRPLQLLVQKKQSSFLVVDDVLEACDSRGDDLLLVEHLEPARSQILRLEAPLLDRLLLECEGLGVLGLPLGELDFYFFDVGALEPVLSETMLEIRVHEPVQ